jgi:hypothetical protein
MLNTSIRKARKEGQEMTHDKNIYLSSRILSPKFVLFMAEKLLRTKKISMLKKSK